MDAVTDNGADSIATHPPCGVRNDPDIIVEHHAEPTVRQDFVDHSLDCEQLFFRHASFTARRGGSVVPIVALAPLEFLGLQRVFRGRIRPGKIFDDNSKLRPKPMNIAVSGDHDDPFDAKAILEYGDYGP